jgi:hypothetical protein
VSESSGMFNWIALRRVVLKVYEDAAIEESDYEAVIEIVNRLIDTLERIMKYPDDFSDYIGTPADPLSQRMLDLCLRMNDAGWQLLKTFPMGNNWLSTDFFINLLTEIAGEVGVEQLLNWIFELFGALITL